MYGTVALIKPRRGKEQDVVAAMGRWDKERRPKVKGAITGYVYQLDKGGMIMVAVFDTKKSYMANAESPAQDRWYRAFRSLLSADPEWNDGKIVYPSLPRARAAWTPSRARR
jgi:hypothetical protein